MCLCLAVVFIANHSLLKMIRLWELAQRVATGCIHCRNAGLSCALDCSQNMKFRENLVKNYVDIQKPNQRTWCQKQKLVLILLKIQTPI